MRRDVNLFFPRRKTTEPGIPRPWTLFIVFSTAVFLGIAAVIALCMPDYRPIAWALVLFSSCHVSFLVVQRIGCQSTESDEHPPSRVDHDDDLDPPA